MAEEMKSLVIPIRRSSQFLSEFTGQCINNGTQTMNVKSLLVTFVLEAAVCLLASATLHAQSTPSPDNFKKAAEYSHSCMQVPLTATPFYGSRATNEANWFASQHHRRAASGGSEARRA